MIIFLLFICFWIGISFRYQIIIFSIIGILIIFLIFYRYRKRLGLLAIGLTIIGVGISYIKIDIKKESYSGIVIDSHPNYFLILSGMEKLYAYNKNNEYEIGDYLKITGTSIESDLRIASGIQMGMLPEKFPTREDRDDVQLYASLTPAK